MCSAAKILIRGSLQMLSRCSYSKFGRKTVNVVGVPLYQGQGKSGVENGPACIRESGIVAELVESGYDVKDLGNVSVQNTRTSGATNLSTVSQFNKELSQTLKQNVQTADVSLVLGGDHSIGIGSIFGHVQSTSDRVGILWVDAHADINTLASSPSGNLHGMPLSFLIKELTLDQPKIEEFAWITPCVPAKHLAYLGLREMDSFEIGVISKLGIKAFNMCDIDHMGIANVMQQVIQHFNSLNISTIHISFDVDAMDPLHAPSTGTPVPGGISLREALYVIEQMAKNYRVRVVDLVEVNPNIGSKQDVIQTVTAAKFILLAAACGVRPHIT